MTTEDGVASLMKPFCEVRVSTTALLTRSRDAVVWVQM